MKGQDLQAVSLKQQFIRDTRQNILRRKFEQSKPFEDVKEVLTHSLPVADLRGDCTITFHAKEIEVTSKLF